MDGFRTAGVVGGAALRIGKHNGPHNCPFLQHDDDMTRFFLEAWMAHEAPRVTATTITKIATPSPTSPVTVDTFQNPRGSEGLKASMAGLGFGVTPWFRKGMGGWGRKITMTGDTCRFDV